MIKKTRSISLTALIVIYLIQFARQNALAINSVLNIKDDFPYLINKTSGQVIEPRDYMNFDNIYVPSETYRQQVTAQGRNYFLFKAFDFANYFQSDYWHYSDEEDLLLSAHPVADKNACSHHLRWIETQVNKTDVLFRPGEQHVQLMTLIDAFGRPEASTYSGHNYWLGDYNQCNRVEIDINRFNLEECAHSGACASNKTGLASTPTNNQNNYIKARYCIGKAHDNDWPSLDNYTPRISYKVGLCLPEACETLSFKHHADQLERLMRLNMPEYMKDRIGLHEIYCLPDSRSPIRRLGTASQIFAGACIAWLIILVVSTWLYTYKKSLKHGPRLMNDIAKDQIRVAEPSKQLVGCISNKLDSHTMFSGQNACDKTGPALADPSVGRSQKEIFGQSSYSPALALASASASRYPLWLNRSPTIERILKSLSISQNMSEFSRPPSLLNNQVDSELLRINLNGLDSIKCLCCILVIFGHVVFIHMQHLTNIMHTVELSYRVEPRLLMAFFNFVDTFFIISGMLTAYFVFKRFNKHTFADPLVWITLIVLRFIRLSSIYVFVFWFSKTMTVHLLDGPIWDYGTDKNSNKGLCINDHWWKTILYLGNWGTMQPLCVLPAWSIIVDSQYSLIIAPVLFIIFKFRKAGYAGLLAATIAATYSMSQQLATQTATNTSDMAKVRLHVYPLISRFAAEFYNTAVNRVGPVAIGILGGHCLYLYETGVIKQWPRLMRGLGFKMILLLHLLVLLMPTIGLFTDNPMSTKETDITIFVICNAAIKPLWSIVNTIFLLRLITDLRKRSVVARLMSHNIWHCLGKLCFASYLIHYEIILILMKSRHDGYPQPNWTNMLREFSLALMLSTIAAYFIYVLLEAPINKLVMLKFEKPRNSSAVRSAETIKTNSEI